MGSWARAGNDSNDQVSFCPASGPDCRDHLGGSSVRRLPKLGTASAIATQIAIYALYALGFNLLLGYTGLVSFGSSAFFGTAGYVAGLVNIHLTQNPIACHSDQYHLRRGAGIGARAHYPSPTRYLLFAADARLHTTIL